MNRAKAVLISLAAFLIALCAMRETHALILPEFSIDQPTDSISAYPQLYPCVAFNGLVYVAAWQDDTTYGTIRLQRFDVTGHPLGPMEALPTNGYIPDIASNGREFMIMWGQSLADGSTQTAAARLDQNGNFIPNSTVTVPSMGVFPRIASNGTDYLVFSTQGNLIYRRLTESGFEPPKFLGDLNLPVAAAIASDGVNYLAVWNSGDRILGVRISGNGDLIDATPFQIAANGAQNASITFAHGIYLVSWQVPKLLGGNLPVGDIFARRIKPDRTMIDATPLTISATGFDGYSGVGPAADGFRIVWFHIDYSAGAHDLRTAKISTGGAVTGNAVLSTFTSPAVVQLAINARGPNSLVLWDTQTDETRNDVLARFVPDNGTPGEIQILQHGPNVERAPSVAYGDNGHLVVWQDNRNSITNREDIFGRFVDRYGRPKESGAFPIGQGDPDQSSPVVAAAGDHYLVVWRELPFDATNRKPADLKAALLINENVVKQFTLVSSTNQQRAAAIASNGGDFLVVWRDGRNASSTIQGIPVGDDIFGMHISHDGILSGPENGFPICTNVQDQTAPAVASNGTNYLVVWRDSRGSDDDIYGAVVEAGSTNLPGEFAISSAVGIQRAPDVASNGRDYFVVWRDDRNKPSSSSPYVGVYGVPVSSTGVVGDVNGFGLTPRGMKQREPSIARLGNDYILAWLENGPTNVNNFHAFARRIYADGSTNSAVVKISETFFDEETLAISSDGTAVGLMVSQTTDMISRVKAAPVCFNNCPLLATASLTADARTLTWNVDPNQTYRVEYKNDLSDGSWQLLQQSTASAEGFLQATDPTQIAMRFYRIVRP